jgi:toxin YhaV
MTEKHRLFFRYHRESRIIIYAWTKDEDTKRAYERDFDTYRPFRRMLRSSNPPDDWNQLLRQAKAQNKRMRVASDNK